VLTNFYLRGRDRALFKSGVKFVSAAGSLDAPLTAAAHCYLFNLRHILLPLPKNNGIYTVIGDSHR
jgi:hypothetical protein